MAPILPSQTAVVASQIIVNTTSSSDSPADPSFTPLSPVEQARINRFAIIVIASIAGSMLFAVTVILCSTCWVEYIDYRRANKRWQSRRERLEARDGKGWFDRWTVTVSRRSAAQRAERRCSLGRDIILPVSTADDLQRQQNEHNGDNATRVIDIARPRPRTRMQRPSPVVYPSGRTGLRSFVGTRNYTDMAVGYQVRPSRRRKE